VSRADVVNAVSTAYTAAAVVIQVLLVVLAVIALLSLFARPVRRVLLGISDTLTGVEVWTAFVIAAFATAGSLFFSEYAHFVPCHLCWFQRIFMYPLTIVFLVAAIRRDPRGAAFTGIPLALIGSGIAIYHVWLEHHPQDQTPGCFVGQTSCATEWIKKLGYVTIPVLSLTAFLAIIAMLSFALANSRATRSPAT
jgi:disulfide bond formation protein DsbB